jgi:hypothetical protein
MLLLQGKERFTTFLKQVEDCILQLCTLESKYCMQMASVCLGGQSLDLLLAASESIVI